MRNKILFCVILLSLLVFLTSWSDYGNAGQIPTQKPVNHFNKGGCKGSPTYPESDSIIITVSGHNVTVLHVDAFYNCCYHITTELVQTGNVINLYEHTSGTPCFCMCYFDLPTTVYDLPPGTYTINVYNADGQYVGGGTATIGGGKPINQPALQ